MINLLNDGLIDELPVEKRHVSALVDVYIWQFIVKLT